jgi:Ni,Fe-hydrogenase III large subunit/Ni,Fe-hydrogenase III component G
VSDPAWLDDYRSRLTSAGVTHTYPGQDFLPPAHSIDLAAGDWRAAAELAKVIRLRLVGLWGDPVESGFVIRACFASSGEYLVLRTTLPPDEPDLPSIAPLYPGADRLERHTHDLLGIQMVNATDQRPWTRHKAWQATDHPLRPSFDAAGEPPRRTPSDTEYEFQRVLGSGVYEIPVGPVHAGIIEPGHFRFQAVGEEVLLLEERLGYVHKGVEKIAVGRDPDALIRLAARVSGDSAVAHAWAACQAIERASRTDVPSRANHLRALLCERERVANHLGDIGAICNDVAFSFAHMQCARLREDWLRRNGAIFGHRLLMDTLVPGGTSVDLETQQAGELRAANQALREGLAPLSDVVSDYPSLDDRLLGTGILASQDALDLGCTGYVGKASGQAFDLRIDAPYPPYDVVRPTATVFTEGDVAARLQVRMGEIHTSLTLLDQLLEQLPRSDHRTSLSPAEPDAVGLGLVDGWRGEIMTFVRFDGEGRIARFFPRDPSWFTWLALERLIHGNIVPDFPVCNKSVNGSYSGSDL